MFQGLYCKLMWIVGIGIFMGSAVGTAAELPADMGGWEKDSAYNQYYNAAEMDQIRGIVERIMEITPIPGMKPGVGLMVREGKSEEPISVHLCPSWFAQMGDIGVRRGEKVKIKGAWAEIDGKDVFMASKIRKGDYFDFKVRLTKDGTPFWTMTPEELARERNSK